MVAQTIQPLAFRFKSACTTIKHQCVVLQFPHHWIDVLKELQSYKTNKPKDKVRLPTGSLNRVIRALIPDITSISRDFLIQGHPWLYSQSQIDSDRLINLIHAWVRVTFQDGVPHPRLQAALESMVSADLQWEVTTINLAAWTTNQAGTAQPESSHAYAILPEYIASILSVHPMNYGSYPLNWKRASLSPGQHGAELISWPPLNIDSAQYSIVLRVTVQTVPFQGYPVIHCDASLRRWASPKVRLAHKEQSSVYIWTSVPWLPGSSGLAHGFQVARIRLKQDGNQWIHVWGDQLVKILTQLRSEGMPLEAEELVSNPQHGLDGVKDFAAAITYNNRMLFHHKIGAGVTIRERYGLMCQVESLLSHAFELVPRPTRVGYKHKPKTTSKVNPFFLTKPQREKQAPAVFAAQRRHLIQETVGSHLTIEIYADDPEVKEALYNATQAEFGFEPSSQFPVVWSAENFKLDVAIYPLNGFSTPLDLPSNKKPRDQVRDATSHRIAQIARQLSQIHSPTVALTEILSKKTYAKEGRLVDPKTALRLGFGKTQRLIQFINPNPITNTSNENEDEEDQSGSISHRARSALLDGLRQLGVIRRLPDISHLPSPLNVVGVWLINKNGNRPGQEHYLLPVMVLLKSNPPYIQAIAPGIEWCPYREAMIAIANDKVNSVNKYYDLSMDFIRTRLRDDVLASGDTLLVCHAQNIRRMWPWMSNEHISPDTINFKRTTTEASDTWRGLRVVRIRDSQRHETPEWYAEQRLGFSATSGLFQMGSRVFASIYDKPKQFAKYSHYFSKIEDWRYPSTQRIAKASPTTATWNPALYELTVAMLQPEDQNDPIPWATLVHALRKYAVHYDEATALPLPLHLARKMEEYVRSIDISDEDLEGGA